MKNSTKIYTKQAIRRITGPIGKSIGKSIGVIAMIGVIGVVCCGPPSLTYNQAHSKATKDIDNAIKRAKVVKHIKAWPNPFFNHLTVEVDASFKDLVTLTTIGGRLHKSGYPDKDGIVKWETGKLRDGVYVIRAHNKTLMVTKK